MQLHNGPLRSCRKIGGKEAAAWQQRRSTRARRNPSPRMIKVTVHEKRRVNQEQPTPAAAHHAITTARCPDNTRSSALVRSRSTKFMARPSCEPRSQCSEIGFTFSPCSCRLQIKRINVSYKRVASSQGNTVLGCNNKGGGGFFLKVKRLVQKIIETRKLIFFFSCFWLFHCGILETQELFTRTYLTHKTTYAYLSLFLDCWNIQENLDSDLFWAGDGRF